MIDLHCHILPAIDDGAPTPAVSVEMAKAFVSDGVVAAACTPHIMPGLYPNTGSRIREAVAALQCILDREDIPLKLFVGADNHIVPDFVAGLRSGHLLPLADSRYVLVEPPHHVLPPRMEELFFNIGTAGFVPILTHPERLTWISSHYAVIHNLVQAGAWMQITAGSLCGSFGQNARYWSERMLDEGLVHILATDAHDVINRPPCLSRGRDAAAIRVGEEEAQHLVSTRPRGVLANVVPTELPGPRRDDRSEKSVRPRKHSASDRSSQRRNDGAGVRRLGQRLWDLIKH